MPSDPGFPFPPGPRGTPPAEFDERRRNAPLAPARLPSGDHARVVVRYADVRTLLASPHLTRELGYPGAPRIVAGSDPEALSNIDPPRHTRIRRLVGKAFLPRQVESWRPRVAAVADELAAGMGGPPADLVSDFAVRLPLRVIFLLLGVPAADLTRFAAWSDVFLSSTAYTPQQRRRAEREFAAYSRELIAQRRAEPGDALIDALIAAHDGGDVLAEDEMVRLVASLIVAGHETTANVLSRGVLSLLTSGQYRTLRESPGLVPGAVEEILRYEMPADGGLLRVTTADVELPSGTIRSGEAVMPSMAAANRDPAAFPDPERFDIARPPRPNMSFGHGAHYCLGAALARQEIEVSLETLLRRFPELRLAVPAEDIAWKSGLLIRGPVRLPVAW
ncbi:cytochrome P450 [Nonomuraea sp. MG754425]|uniref:cytochrome P450 n=1 Tax=Nonomuraea sp. MG754425 TaxID=2570319 RepID=UPI001F3E11BC|nr:cytochrome P450 [Nonomuraea sp. MG754425]MCF6472148.1 cytochrome P450 [Nonomuraea sp. MG754425]